MIPHILCQLGNDIPYADFMHLINRSFNYMTPDSAFEGLLPKCYREQYRPQDENYIVTEDGVPAAAVGAFNHEIIVCGRRLACRGIGNVAVHPDYRAKGYMKMAMNMATEDMKKDGIVLSALGGQRQRYQYFGYDRAGAQCSFQFSPRSIHHVYGDASSSYTCRRVIDPEDAVIDEIIGLTGKKAYVPVRPRNKYLDIANTWKADLLTFTDPADGDNFVGYCIVNKSDTITEVAVVRPEQLMGIIHSVYVYLNKGFTVNIPVYDVESIAVLAAIAEEYTLGTAMMYNIFNYAAVIDAFMALKLSYTRLPDGALTILIHGFAKDETLHVALKDGKHTVTQLPDDAPTDLELDHLQAIDLLFSPVSALREAQNYLVKAWFPIPIWIYSADEV